MRFGKAQNMSTWFLHLFLFYKEKIFRQLIPIMAVIAVYALAVVYFDKNTNKFAKIDALNLGQFHLIFSFILGILISFRINSTFNRWWEGRVLWGGIVNNCRNLGLKFDNFVGFKNCPEFYDYLQALPVMMKLHLRKDVQAIDRELNKLGIAQEVNHSVVLIAQKMYGILNSLRDEEKIRFEQYMAMDIHLANLIDLLGGCERIANTGIPPTFAFFIKQGLLFYALIFPFGWVDEFGYLIIPLILMIVYTLLGLEILSEELEDPFGCDENDLPLDLITANIDKNLRQIADL